MRKKTFLCMKMAFKFFLCIFIFIFISVCIKAFINERAMNGDCDTKRGKQKHE